MNPSTLDRSRRQRSLHRWRSFVLLAALFVMASSVFAQNVNVTATAGTPAASYATLNAAFGAINAGTHQGVITCTVVANTTEPAAAVPLLPSGGTSSYTSILINCTGNVTVNSAATATASRGVIEIQGDNVTIDGDDAGTAGTRNLTFQAVAQATTGVAVVRFASPSAADGATGNTIRNCIVIGSRNSITSTVVNFGIYAGVNGTGATSATGTGDNLDNLTIQNNEVRRTWWGIYVSGTAANKADNLIIRNNLVGSTVGTDVVVLRGIYIQNTQTTPGAASALVEGNDVSIRADAGGTATDIANIEVANGNGGAIIRGNKIHDGLHANTGGQGCYGIFVTGATDNTGIEISNNFIWDLNNDNWSTAISATSADIPIGIKVSVAVTGLKIVHNTISLDKANNDPATAGYSACLQFHSTGATGSTIRNNIFSNTQVAQAASVHVCVLVPAGFPFSTINNNDYYETQTYTYVGWNGATRSTLADWQGQTLQDGASTAANPSFTSTTNLHISGTPAALNNAGASVGVVTDIDGEFRSSPPDIGADEFTIAACGSPVATASTQQDCANTQFFINVNLTSLSAAPSVDIVSDYAGNPGADLGVTTTGTYQLGPFPSNTNVVVSVLHNGNHTCDVSLSPLTYNCAFFGQNALSFDGSNDRVDCGNGATVSLPGTAITLEAWIYPTAWQASAFQGSIINKEGPNVGYMLRCGNNGQLSFALGNGTTIPELLSATGALSLNTWQHVAATYDGVTMRIFRDGVQIGSLANTASTANSATQLTIGDYAVTPGTRVFIGKIDEVRIWGTALSQATLAANMNAEYCGNEADLRAYYRFNHGVENANNAGVTTLTDITANANNGTLVNFALNGTTSNWVPGKTGLTACVACNAAPTAGTISGTASICSTAPAATLTLTGASTGLGISRQWAYGPVGGPYTNLLGTAATQSTAGIPVGVWEVVVTTTCSGFGSATTPAFAFTKLQTPSMTASSNSPVCAGSPLQLTGTTDIGTSFAWTGPNGFTSTTQSPLVSATATLSMAGAYLGTATLNGCTSAASSTTVVINPQPTVTAITATPNPTCVGGNSQLNVTGVVDQPFVRIVEFTFFRTGTGLTSPWPAVIPTGPDDYVELNNTSGLPADISGWTYADYSSGSATANHTLTFPANTVIPANGYIVIGLATGTNDPANYYYAATGTSGFYSSGGTAGFILRNASNVIVDAVVANGGTFNAGLGVTAGDWSGAGAPALSGNAGSRRTAAVDSNTGADWTTSSTAGATQTIGTFNPGYTNTNQGVVASYLWSPSTFLDNPAIANPLASAVTATTPYSVTLTSGAGCQSTANITVTANPALSGGSTITPAAPAYCAGSSVTLTANPGGGGAPYTYQWYRPDLSLAGTAATQVANQPGTWSVDIFDACGGSQLGVSITVVENPLPTAIPSSNVPCTSQALNFTGTSDIGTTFTWTGPNGFTSALQNPSIASATTAATGNYIFTAFSAVGCSSGPATLPIVVNSAPVLSTPTATPNPICTGGSAQLNITAAIPGFVMGSGGATFIDISGSGTDVPGALGDDSEHNITMPSFTFNGVAYTTARVGTNGAFFFGSTTGDNALTETALPTGAHTAGNVFLAPWWDDLDVQTIPTIRTQTVGNKFIVQWNNMDHNNVGLGTNGITFQIQMDLVSGAIHFLYNDVSFGNATYDAGLSATVGIQWANAVGGAVQYSFDQALLTNGQVISFTPNQATVTWSPNTYLNNAFITNPVASNVTSSTSYSVSATANGCTSLSNPVVLNVDPPPAATITSVPDCANSQWSLGLAVTSVGTGTNVTFQYTVNGGAPVNIGPFTVASVIPNIGPFAQNDIVNLTLLHESNVACNVAYGNYYTPCPYEIVCPASIPVTHCYGNNDSRTWTFLPNSGGETVTVSFVSGSMDPNDVIRAYDGPDDTYPSIASLTGSFANLAGVSGSTTVPGQAMYIEIDSDNSNSCQDAQQSTWVFEAECTAGCVDPTASISTVLDCANQQFSIDVTVDFVGDGTSADLEYTVNGGTPVVIPELLEFDFVNIGPFNLGDNVGIRLLHDLDAACDHNYGIFTESPLACPNDEPCDARPLTVNPDYTCTVTTPGTMAGSTLTPGITGPCGTAVQDVWFTFVATGPTHRVTLGGSIAGLNYSLWTAATCAGPFTVHPGFGCISSANVTDFNGLTTGQTYYLRVSRTPANSANFTVCVSAPPAAFAGQNAIDFDGTNDRVNCGTASSIDITGNAITLEAWIYPTAWRTSSFQGNIVNKEGTNTTGYMIRCGNNGQLSFNFGTGTNWVERISATGALSLNTWQHVAGTFDGTNVRIFRDGVELTPVTSTGTIAPIASTGTIQGLTVGNWSQNDGRGFIGKIDEVRVWNTALSQATIAANMNQEMCGGELGLRAYYQFNQGIDGGNNAGVTTLPDASGNGNNGTLVNLALNGPTSNWVQGKTGTTPCPPCSSAPTAGTISGTTPVCSTVANTLALVGPSTGTGITYQWYYGPVGTPMANLLGTSLSQSTASIPVGTWEVVVDVTCSGFGTAQTAVFTFVKDQTPTATASAGAACTGQTLNLTGTTDVGTTFSWTGPNSFTSALQNPTIASLTSAATGTYTFTSTLGSCSASGTVVVSVVTTPVVTAATATPNPICINGTSQLNATAPVAGYVMGAGGASFIDISVTGTAVPSTPNTLGDDSEHAVTIPAPGFSFNGTPYTSLLVGNNGAMVFGVSTGTIGFTNAALGTTLFGGSVGIGLAPWWDDLDLATLNGTTSIKTQVVGNKFIIQYTNSDHNSINTTSTDHITFQVQLDQVTGEIHFVYQDVSFANATLDGGASATVGLQWNTSGTGFLQHSFNTNSLTNGQVISFTPNQASFTWSPATYLTATNIANPQAVAVAGSITYSVTGSVAGCASAPVQVNLVANPALSGGSTITPASPFFCTGSSVTLTANPGGGGGPYVFTWTAPGGSPTVGAQTQVANTAGLWTVDITDNCGGVDQATINVSQFQTPTANASAGLACLGLDLALTGTTDIGTSYAWTGPNGFTSTLQNPTVSPVVALSAGTYSFIASTANCSSAPATVAVTVNTSPVINSVTATPNTFCAGGNSQLQVNVAGPSAYCASNFTSVSFEFLTNVTFGSINNTTAGTIGGPVDYTAQVANVTAGSSYTLSVTMDPDANDYIYAWFDWNQNGSFADGGEGFVLVSNSSAAGPHTLSIPVPLTAVNGNTRMRVMVDWNNATPNPCRSATFGETEDYTVNVSGGVTAVSYSWNNPGGFLSATNIANPVATGVTTTPSVLYTATVTAGNGCAVSSNVTVTVNPLPVVTCGGPYGPYCVDDADVTLAGSPVGGTWSGTGVTVGGIFDPSAGTQTLTYTYTDGNNCSSSCQVTITVFTTDTDGDGLADCTDECPNIFGEIGDACDAGPGFVLGTIDAGCTCVGVSCTTNLSLEFQTDGVSNVGWEIRTQGSNILVHSGSGVYPQSPGFGNSFCLPDGCYYLVVTDDAGDGFTSNGVQGGYILRTLGAGAGRVIDNSNNFLTGFTSQIAGGEGFCIPMGTDRLIYTSCDKLDWRANEYIVANDNPNVTAQWLVGDQTDDGYEMWWFNPNGGYSFRRFHSHAVSDGFGPASATRACHIKINNWSVANHIASGVLLNVKVRSRVNGVNSSWGPVCKFKRDEVRAQCALTKLMDIPGNAYYSCGATRNIGPSNLVHARPITRVNGNNPAQPANRYQFRFRIPAENITIIKTSATGQYWVPVTQPLQACKTYQVDVRASFDNGATWCTDFILPALTDPWGDVCLFNTACSVQGGGQNMATENTGAAMLYPNPNRGEQVVLNLSSVDENVLTVSVDIYDAFGKRVNTRTIPVQDGFVNTTLDLDGQLAAGMYMVNITAGDKTYTERLVIQP